MDATLPNATNFPKIFLSHRHDDKNIADVVRKHLGRWAFDSNQVYQSSAPGLGVTVGDNIFEELKSALYNAKLVILIYTCADEDWSFSMWECGLATHPVKVDTRTVVFQCNPHNKPKVFEGQLLVRVDEQGISNFTTQFFREENFFPGEEALRPDITDETLRDYSTEFFNDLSAVLPVCQPEERYRWDFLTLRLSHAELIDLQALEEDVAISKLPELSQVKRGFGEALKHFGYANFEPGLRLNDLIERWGQSTANRENTQTDWIEELLAEMYRAINNRPANAEWKKMSSAFYDKFEFHPVVNHVRIDGDGSMEFDVYLYRSLGDR